MEFFDFQSEGAFDYEQLGSIQKSASAIENGELIQTFGPTRSDGSGKTGPDTSNQFVIFQLSSKKDGPAILEASQVEPVTEGSDAQPDMLLDLEMLNFNISETEDIDRNANATMRITVGKDENSRDKNFDTVFWTIASGLKLFNELNNQRTDGKDLKADVRKAFGNRPIEIPGGLGKMSFEVIRHQEPKWWQSIFKFLQSGTGKALTSTIGFPAITSTAINVIDELLNRLDNSKPDILFKSMPLRLALSKQAKNDFAAGSERVRVGSLNPGFAILARAKDYARINETDCIYYPMTGRLAPSNIPESTVLSGNFEDPFRNITYSIFRIGMKQTKLDPSFNYGG